MGLEFGNPEAFALPQSLYAPYPSASALSMYLPPYHLYTMQLVEAFREYDAFFALSRRKYIPPNFAELRHVVNIAQVCVCVCGGVTSWGYIHDYLRRGDGGDTVCPSPTNTGKGRASWELSEAGGVATRWGIHSQQIRVSNQIRGA